MWWTHGSIKHVINIPSTSLMSGDSDTSDGSETDIGAGLEEEECVRLTPGLVD